MGSVVAVIAKAMPESPDVDLEVVQNQIKEKLTEEGAMNMKIEEKPVAFGLKALFFTFAWPEEKDTDIIEKAIEGVEGVSSGTIEDYRRAFG